MDGAGTLSLQHLGGFMLAAEHGANHFGFFTQNVSTKRSG
ncbi:hypothetical protein SAMN03159371_04372 [Variovorax sp. NFACC28]|nr:hypothetical protein SAMN03159371_04372 [Variovorax sp. NFACC28]SEG86037.1 hypothetical protein SAMN03159365_04720 [Variovorax sp. NFACC29]SFD22741.1 hypothetical protein SAMN03159379_04609 [Variovorax sp. NFACC26]SFG29549.1 hypothetical protein SAMN03159447_02719 [Variovorax sp. NFACC27]